MELISLIIQVVIAIGGVVTAIAALIAYFNRDKIRAWFFKRNSR